MPAPPRSDKKSKPENPVRVSWAIGGRNPSTCISSLFHITKLMRRYVPHFSLLKKKLPTLRMQFLTSPFAYSGRELVDGSVVVNASMHGGAVKVSERIDNHPVIGKRAIWGPLEHMNYSLHPVTAANGAQLKDGAQAQTTLTRSPIEIAGRVKNKIADGAIAVGSALEAIEYFLPPFAVSPRSQLVRSADIISPAVISGSIDITRSIEEQRAIGKTPVRLASE